MTKVCNSSPKSTDIPIFAVASETDFLQKLAVEKSIDFELFCFYIIFTGVEGMFECVLLILPYKAPKGKILANGPANAVKQHLKPLVLQYIL